MPDLLGRSSIVCGTDQAGAGLLGEVADAHRYVVLSVGNAEDLIEKRLLPILEVAAESICAEISDLNHACELAVYEERRLDYVADLSPQGPLAVKVLHEVGVFLGDGLIVVVYQEA